MTTTTAELAALKEGGNEGDAAMTTGYKHRECATCGTEIGFSEKFQDCGEYVICQECHEKCRHCGDSVFLHPEFDYDGLVGNGCERYEREILERA